MIFTLLEFWHSSCACFSDKTSGVKTEIINIFPVNLEDLYSENDCSYTSFDIHRNNTNNKGNTNGNNDNNNHNNRKYTYPLESGLSVEETRGC